MKNEFKYDWSAVDEAIRCLSEQIKESGWMPDYVVGIVRGGAVPAVMLSHRLGVPVQMLRWSTRDLSLVANEMNCWIPEDIMEGKKVLIVEDIIDSGQTIQEILDDWTKSVHQKLVLTEVKVCSILFNKSQSVYADYCYQEIDRNTDTRWYVFPWEG